MIKFRNVNKSFGRNTVLKDISFTVDKGNPGYHNWSQRLRKNHYFEDDQPGLIKPTSGDIFIGGENIRDKDVIQLSRGMGYVPATGRSPT